MAGFPVDGYTTYQPEEPPKRSLKEGVLAHPVELDLQGGGTSHHVGKVPVAGVGGRNDHILGVCGLLTRQTPAVDEEVEASEKA